MITKRTAKRYITNIYYNPDGEQIIPSTTTTTTTTIPQTTVQPSTTIPQTIFAEFIDPVSISDWRTTRYITPAWNVWCTDSDTHGIYVGYRATWTRYDGSTYIDDNFWINTYVTLDNTYTFHKDASFSCDGNNPELILDMFILEIINDSVGINASPSLAIDNPEVYGFKLLKSIRYSIDCYDLL